MMGIGFLGYFNIAQNDYNIYNKTAANAKLHNNRRHYSTSAIYSLRTDKKNKASNRIKNFLHYKNLKPVFIYDNINEDSVRKNIAKETKGLSGIYMILNKETLSYYIGSASTDRINSRFTNHLI